MRSMRLVAVLALAAALAGCGGRVPPTHYYVLEPHDLPRPVAAGGASLGIESFQVDPPYDQDRIVYRVGDSAEVGFYAYHRWAAPLERMLPRLAAASFGELDGVGSAEPVSSGHDYDALLRGRLLALEEIDTAAGQRVQVRLVLRLFAEGRAVWSETVSGQAELSTDEVGDVVDGMRSAVADALAGARPGLQRALETLSR